MMLLLRARWLSLALRAAVLAGGWWALSEDDPDGRVFGGVVAALALLVSTRLPATRSATYSPIGLARFAGSFTVRSVLAGIDVARLAFAPRRSPAPAVIQYALRLPAGPARNLFIGSMALLPGSLAMRIDGQQLEIHLLDHRPGILEQLEDWERVVARALGERLEDPRA